MAEGFTQNKKDVLCRYFMHGTCALASNCLFSHDRGLSRPSTFCKFYQKGSCTYGNGCRYDHIRPEKLGFLKNDITGGKKPLDIHKVPQLEKEESVELQTLNLTNLSLLKKPNSDLSADAPIFIPKQLTLNAVKNNVSYAEAAGFVSTKSDDAFNDYDPSSELCPFYCWKMQCYLADECPYIHGDVCDMCQTACLLPNDEKQRESHYQECMKDMEEHMDESFAIARSNEKVCGICMEVVWECNSVSQQRFGILENCSHCFCVKCIRKWRQSKQFENDIVRSCPECRIRSDYIIPSKYWVDDKEKNEKDKLVSSYRAALSKKHCKYFNKGQGECPFGNKCFYNHELPDGTKQDVGPPKRKKRFDDSGNLQVYVDETNLEDFLEVRDHRLEMLRDSILLMIRNRSLEENDDTLLSDVSDD